jgi:hypothetical protein
MLEALIFQELPCTGVFSVREAESKNCPSDIADKPAPRPVSPVQRLHPHLQQSGLIR